MQQNHCILRKGEDLSQQHIHFVSVLVRHCNTFHSPSVSENTQGRYIGLALALSPLDAHQCEVG